MKKKKIIKIIILILIIIIIFFIFKNNFIEQFKEANIPIYKSDDNSVIPIQEQLEEEYITSYGTRTLVADKKNCLPTDSTIKYNNKKWCFSKNDYKDLSIFYEKPEICEIYSGLNTIIGYSDKNMNGAVIFNQPPSKMKKITLCNPHSVKVK
jgi:hypothetical protein